MMAECVVRRQIPAAGKVMCAVMVILTALIGILGVLTLVLLPAFILSVIFTIIFCNKLKIEYEYSYADGILTIDRIINGKKRKQCLELGLGRAERICPYRQEHGSGSNEAAVLTEDYASGRPDARVYTLLFESNGRRYKVIFEPDDKMLNAIRQTMPEIMY
ncbi:hypothetical protein GPL15_14215 [Clostridium sp. MCC353]|uniref:DUF6106 family protein n=1 Tax=Clostridium sp. MCC353 TaxID=2592646 RepID=UPI001C039EAC|nr:DUF6106 family protein [Clostridium sp. MCC353]MBT9777655.1 hypothetical protein [Clostridium sp. MCC353]